MAPLGQAASLSDLGFVFFVGKGCHEAWEGPAVRRFRLNRNSFMRLGDGQDWGRSLSWAKVLADAVDSRCRLNDGKGREL